MGWDMLDVNSVSPELLLVASRVMGLDGAFELTTLLHVVLGATGAAGLQLAGGYCYRGSWKAVSMSLVCGSP